MSERIELWDVLATYGTLVELDGRLVLSERLKS